MHIYIQPDLQAISNAVILLFVVIDNSYGANAFAAPINLFYEQIINAVNSSFVYLV